MMASRPQLPKQIHQHIWFVSFSFLLPEKCKHEIIFKEVHFHLLSSLRSPPLPHPQATAISPPLLPLTIIPLGFPLGHHPLLARRLQLHLAFLRSRSLHGSWADVHQYSTVLPVGSVPPTPPALGVLTGVWDGSLGAVVGFVPSSCRNELPVQ